MAKLKPAGKRKSSAPGAQLARGLPCLFIVIGGIVLVGTLFYLILKGS